MNRFRILVLYFAQCFTVLSVTITGIFLVGVTSASAQNFSLDEISFSVEPESSISILGNSTGGAFRCQSTDIDGGGRAGRKHETTGEPFVEATVASLVSRFDCRNVELSADLHKILRYVDHDVISFTIDDVFARQATEYEGGDFSLRLMGHMTIGGFDLVLDLHLIAVRESFFTFRLRGTHDVLWTEIGIDPASALPGLSGTDNKITFDFDLVLTPSM